MGKISFEDFKNDVFGSEIFKRDLLHSKTINDMPERLRFLVESLHEFRESLAELKAPSSKKVSSDDEDGLREMERFDSMTGDELEAHIQSCNEARISEEHRIAEIDYLYDLDAAEKLYNAEIQYLRDIISIPQKDEKSDENRSWFKVGVLFANGRMYDCLKKNNGNFEKTSKELFGEKYNSYRPYISISAGSSGNKSDKNIFAQSKKIEAIKMYCEKNNILLDPRFLKAIITK